MAWTSAQLFGPQEWALRLPAMLFGVSTLFLFRQLAERTLTGLAVPIAVALVAIGLPFIKYSSEVKQYAGDAMVAVLLTLVAVRLLSRDASTKELVATGVAGFVVIWFSQASVIVMGGIGVAFLVDWARRRDREAMRRLFIPIPMWAVASLVALVIGLRSMTPATQEFMDAFWRPGFFPWPMQGIRDLGWFYRQVASVFSDLTLLVYPWAPVYVIVLVVGYVSLWRTRRSVALVLVMPLFLALVAAVAQQYPFRGRLMMYLVPSALLATAAGMDVVRRTAGRMHVVAGALAAAALLVAPVLAIVRQPPPYEIEHNRTMLGYLQQHRQPGDVIYTFPLPRIGTLFYASRFGLQPGDIRTVRCDRMDTRAYLRDADQMRGKARVWLLSSGGRVFRTARPAVRGYLGTIGVRRDSVARRSLTQGDVTLELYDLSDPARLTTASAETYPVQPMPTDPRPGCRPWVMPDAPLSLR